MLFCTLATPTSMAAIGNAIAKAMGVRLTELPMNSERVFFAMKAKEDGS